MIVKKILNDMKILLSGLCKGTEFEFNPSHIDLHQITTEISKKDRALIGKFYDTARSLLSTIEVASDNTINSIAKGYMNSENLVLQINDQIMRIDLPAESQRYLEIKIIKIKLPCFFLGIRIIHIIKDQKSITIYVPLQSGNLTSGGLLVAFESHKKGLVEHVFDQKESQIGSKSVKGISYTVPNKIVDNHETKILHLNFSEILIFDMDLIHRSVPNTSGKTRFNLQVRLSDLNDNEFCKRYSTIKTKYHLNLKKKNKNL